MAKTSGAGCGCLTLLVAVALIVGGILNWTTNGWVGCVAGIVLLIAGGMMMPATSCELCGANLKRTTYAWKINGKSKAICPSCNRSMSARKSAAAVARLHGEEPRATIVAYEPERSEEGGGSTLAGCLFGFVLVALCIVGIVLFANSLAKSPPVPPVTVPLQNPPTKPEPTREKSATQPASEAPKKGPIQ